MCQEPPTTILKTDVCGKQRAQKSLLSEGENIKGVMIRVCAVQKIMTRESVFLNQVWWCMPALWDTEAGELQVKAQPSQFSDLIKPCSKKKKN